MPTHLPSLKPRISRIIVSLFIIFIRDKKFLVKKSPFCDHKSLKSHLPWYLRNRFLRNTTRSWWVYCWMRRRFAHLENTIIYSQLYSRVQAESADHLGSFHISETPLYPARNLQEITRVLICIKPVFHPTCPFKKKITYHFLGQSPLLHIHEEPRTRNCSPQSLGVK